MLRLRYLYTVLAAMCQLRTGRTGMHATADRAAREADMELEPGSTDRLPFHSEEVERALGDTDLPSRDARIRHLQRVPLFAGFTEDELRRIAELSRIVEAREGTVITQ